RTGFGDLRAVPAQSRPIDPARPRIPGRRRHHQDRRRHSGLHVGGCTGDHRAHPYLPELLAAVGDRRPLAVAAFGSRDRDDGRNDTGYLSEPRSSSRRRRRCARSIAFAVRAVAVAYVSHASVIRPRRASRSTRTAWKTWYGSRSRRSTIPRATAGPSTSASATARCNATTGVGSAAI